MLQQHYRYRHSSVLSETPQRPRTLWERITSFTPGVYRLYQDYALYCNIQDAASTAARTERHAWRKQARPGPTTLSFFSSSSHKLYIPWRQQAQQRQFLKAFYTVAPVVALFMLPIVGYLPMLLAVLFPRQWLSRHFYTEWEVRHYLIQAAQQRRAFYPAVRQAAVRRALVPSHWEEIEPIDDDPAFSPEQQLRALYHAFVGGAENDARCFVNHTHADWMALALATGLYSTFPTPRAAECAAAMTPTWYLRRHVRHGARALAHDDARLASEWLWRSLGSDNDDKVLWLLNDANPSLLHTLTTVEFMDACLERGLPMANVSREQMCAALLRHVRTMALLWRIHEDEVKRMNGTAAAAPEVIQERMGLLALHLSMLRPFKNDCCGTVNATETRNYAVVDKA